MQLWSSQLLLARTTIHLHCTFEFGCPRESESEKFNVLHIVCVWLMCAQSKNTWKKIHGFRPIWNHEKLWAQQSGPFFVHINKSEGIARTLNKKKRESMMQYNIMRRVDFKNIMWIRCNKINEFTSIRCSASYEREKRGGFFRMCSFVHNYVSYATLSMLLVFALFRNSYGSS